MGVQVTPADATRIRRSHIAALQRGDTLPLDRFGSNTTLVLMLQLAVPLWIKEVQSLTPDARFALLEGAADAIASRGDVLQFGGGKKGEAAELFNILARALAVMAYVPGGVRFAGNHWEAK